MCQRFRQVMDFHTFQPISHSVCRCVGVELCTFGLFLIMCVSVCGGSCVNCFFGVVQEHN